ncbi:MAG: DUF3788 family protein [Planctomycetota bacterium]|nr:DUF3788 family protein [Planctomycetota bacterium]
MTTQDDSKSSPLPNATASGLMTMTYERMPWIDCFNQPSIKQLKSSLGDEPSTLFDLVNSKLAKIEGVTPDLKWFGDGWHWTVSYFTGHGEDPLAILIPNPEDVQLAMPLDPEFLKLLPQDQIKKTVRDGLELATTPFDSNWAVWSLDSAGTVKEILDVIKLKLKFLIETAR